MCSDHPDAAQPKRNTAKTYAFENLIIQKLSKCIINNPI